MKSKDHLSEIDDDVQSIPLEVINPPIEWRRIIEANIDILAQSMAENGQLQSIGLVPAKERGRFDLKWGETRRRAAIKLGWKDIKANVLHNLSPAQANLVTLEENLARNGYSCVLEEAIARAKQKELYIQLHPETRRGGDRHTSVANPNPSVMIPPFTVAAAKSSNQSRDKIELLVKIGNKLAPFANKLYDTPLEDNLTELLALARYEGDLEPVIQKFENGSASTVAEAVGATIASPGSVQLPGSEVPQIVDTNHAETSVSAHRQNVVKPETITAVDDSRMKNELGQDSDPSLELRINGIEERLAWLENIPQLLADQIEDSSDPGEKNLPSGTNIWILFWKTNDLLEMQQEFVHRSGFKCPKCDSKYLRELKICGDCGQKFSVGYSVKKK